MTSQPVTTAVLARNSILYRRTVKSASGAAKPFAYTDSPRGGAIASGTPWRPSLLTHGSSPLASHPVLFLYHAVHQQFPQLSYAPSIPDTGRRMK
jgi:hypothetical protein